MPVNPTPVPTLPTPPSTDDPSNFDERGDAFLGQLPDFGDAMNDVAANVYGNAVEAANAAGAAATSAIGASNSKDQAAIAAAAAADSASTALNAPGTNATSTTSMAITDTGTVNLMVEPGKLFKPYMFVLIANSVGKFMHGQVVGYDPSSGALAVNPTYKSGSGTYSTWVVSLSAPVINAGALSITALQPGTATANQLVRISADGQSVVGVDPASVGVAKEDPVLISTNTNAVSGKFYIFTAACTLTLPASPAKGDWIDFANQTGKSRGPIIARNGNNIVEKASDLVINTRTARGRLTWTGDVTKGWINK